MSVKTRSTCSTASSVFAIEWNCHCCTAINSSHVKNCRVCGRPDTYALQGYHLPFHGKNAKLFRPGQILSVLDNIHEVDSEGWGSLHSACANGNSDIVKELLKLKAKVEAITNKGETPLHMAVFAGSYECVSLLIKHKAQVNVVTYEEKKTPLHMACENGFAKIAQLLILNGADIHALNIMQRTPLHCVAISGRTDLGLLLLRAGAKYDAIDAQGWTARQIAELFQKREFQELMIRQNMTEKQAVFKEVPPAPWHSSLWSDVIDMQAHRHEQYELEKERQAADDHKFSMKRIEAAEAEFQRKRDERQAELLIQHNNKASTMMQQAVDKANHKAALTLLKGTPLAITDSAPQSAVASGANSPSRKNSHVVSGSNDRISQLKKESTALSILNHNNNSGSNSRRPSAAPPSAPLTRNNSGVGAVITSSHNSNNISRQLTRENSHNSSSVFSL